MKTFVLISCVKSKRDYKCKAKDLYISAFFQKALEYARKLQPDDNNIKILSSKYGLVNLDDEIAPYDTTFNHNAKNVKVLSKAEKKEWGEKILKQLKEISDINKDKFVIIAGKNYYEDYIDNLKNYKLPIKNLKIGEALSFLNHENK